MQFAEAVDPAAFDPVEGIPLAFLALLVITVVLKKWGKKVIAYKHPVRDTSINIVTLVAMTCTLITMLAMEVFQRLSNIVENAIRAELNDSAQYVIVGAFVIIGIIIALSARSFIVSEGWGALITFAFFVVVLAQVVPQVNDAIVWTVNNVFSIPWNIFAGVLNRLG